MEKCWNFSVLICVPQLLSVTQDIHIGTSCSITCCCQFYFISLLNCQIFMGTFVLFALIGFKVIFITKQIQILQYFISNVNLQFILD